MSAAFPSFERGPHSPAIPDAFTGVALGVGPKVDLGSAGGVPVHGVFQVPEAEAQAVPGGDPFAALVLLVVDTKNYVPFSYNVVGRAILLDGAPAPKGMFRGYFNVDPFRANRRQPKAGRYFISAYWGPYQTTPVAVDVSGELTPGK